MDFPGGSDGKESACQCKRPGFARATGWPPPRPSWPLCRLSCSHPPGHCPARKLGSPDPPQRPCKGPSLVTAGTLASLVLSVPSHAGSHRVPARRCGPWSGPGECAVEPWRVTSPERGGALKLGAGRSVPVVALGYRRRTTDTLVSMMLCRISCLLQLRQLLESTNR